MSETASNAPDIFKTSGEVVLSPVSAVAITKNRYILPDGKNTIATVIKPTKRAKFDLRIDSRFVDRGIVLDNRRLISQSGTKNDWNAESVGIKPEDFIHGDNPALALDPTNAGWQKEALWVNNGEPVLIANDKGNLSGDFDIFGLTQEGEWTTEKVRFSHGKPESQDGERIKNFRLGFDIPIILRDGSVLPMEDYIGHPRLLADARNIFNYGVADNLQGEFWQLIRPYLAETRSATSRLQKRSLIVTSAVVPEQDTERLKRIIDESGMKDTFFVRRNPDIPERSQLLIKGELPLNRIPLFGIGYDTGHNLVIVSFDGRQKESAGATLHEASYIMKDSGIITGGLGSAGGDVAVVDNKGNILNSPSSADRKSRPVPSILMIY